MTPRPDLNKLAKEVVEQNKLDLSQLRELLLILQVIELNQRPILHLNLKGDWYFEIEHGDKRQEYREVKPHYDRIFNEFGYVKIKGIEYHATEILVCFSNGYATDRPQMYWTLHNLAIAQGKEKWGARKDVEYYTLYLDEDVTDKIQPNKTIQTQ